MPSLLRTSLVVLLAGGLTAARGQELEVQSVVVGFVAEVELAAEEAGPLVELAVREGSRVKTGDRLGRLDDRDAALQVVRAQITHRHAEAQAKVKVKLLQAEEARKLAGLELDRATTANQELSGVVSETQLSKLQLALRRAELDVEQATEDRAAAARAVEAAANELALAERARERRTLISPMDGTVVEIRRRAGEWLEPGQVVLRLVRDDRLRATGFVRLDQLSAPVEGQAATLLVPGGGGRELSFAGLVTFVSPEANPINRQVKLMAEFDNPHGRLRSGSAAKLIIRLEPAPATSAE